MDPQEPCQNVDILWINSRGERFDMCEKHVKLAQMVADDYEQTAEKEFRVIKRDDSNK